MPDEIAIYARYSTDRQDARSIDDQLRRCREYVERAGYQVAEEFTDAAVSGAHMQREQLRRMLDAANSSRRPFRAVLVDDLSRLSRDLGATWNIIFDNLAAVSVKVIDVSTGMASDDPNARVTFGAKALVNDMFLQIVRAQTHRGLEGRALGGFWTGGKIYGYSTVTEENPPDPTHPRKVSVIDETEAGVVRNVFTMFIGGMGLKAIADRLNRDGVNAPHDNGRGNKNGRGWGHTSIRNMLRNERYIGHWIWNASKWVRIHGRKTRQRRKREDRERVIRELPHLAIIDMPTWKSAHQRIQREHRGRGGRPAGSGKYTYPTSGLLRCGICGGSMSIVGGKKKNGVRYSTFGCQSHHNKGGAICGNDLTISERKITLAVTKTVSTFLLKPETIQRITAEVARQLGQNSVATPEIDSAEAAVLQAERRQRNVTEALAKAGLSSALLEQLQLEQRRLEAAREQLASLQGRVQPVAIPSAKIIRSYLVDLAKTLSTNPAGSRELLARHISAIVLTPKGESPGRHYVGSGAFVFLGEQVLENVSSGGTI